MKKPFTRVIILIILSALLIALPVEIIGLFRNQKAFETEAEEKTEYAIQSAGIDLDMVFNSMSNLVNMLHSTVQVTFSGRDYLNDYDTFLQLKKQTGDIIKHSLEKTEHISGMYVTFSTQLYTGMEEIWYAYEKGKVRNVDAREFVSKSDWLVKNNPRVSYYYHAIENGEYWGALDYESSLNEYMATHTKSVYDYDGNLIGIVGSDMLMNEIDDILKSMKIYSDSQIVLFDDNMHFCASSEDMENPIKHYSALNSQIQKSYPEASPIWYEASDGQKHIAAYTTLNNGWILATTQTADTVMTSANETRRTLVITMLLTILIIIIMVIILIKRFYEPVVKSAQQNEILLINQSRQAKLGEMIGNIAHQCKQPLNNINIDMSNMKDDYRDDELTEDRFNEYQAKIRESVSIMSSTITDFAGFLKPDRQKERFSLKDSVNKALSIMNENLVINEISITNDVAEDIFITNYRNEFIQCIFNVLENARDAAISSEIKPAVIKIYSDVKNTGDTAYISLNIYNSGKNISAEDRKKIFLPYYSTKENNGGTGIGLYMAKQIIENHFDGHISFVNNENGVTFTISVTEKGAEHGRLSQKH